MSCSGVRRNFTTAVPTLLLLPLWLLMMLIVTGSAESSVYSTAESGTCDAADSETTQACSSSSLPTKSTSWDWEAWQAGLMKNRKQNAEDTESNLLKGTCFEEYWNDLPSLVVEQPDDSKDDAHEKVVKFSIQGDSFRGRMATVKYLIEELDVTEKNGNPSILWGGPQSPLHFLWGFASFVDWEHRTGRLSYPDKTVTDQIARNWWSVMNFGLIVCVFLGAQEAGVIQERYTRGKVEYELDEASRALLRDVPEMDKAIEAWKKFFSSGYKEYRNTIFTLHNTSSFDALTIEKKSEHARFLLQKEVWEAHLTVVESLDNGTMSQSLLEKLPAPEAAFAYGWSKMVGILGNACFPSDLMYLLHDGAGHLPTEVVTDEGMVYRKNHWNELSTPEKRRFKAVLTMHDVVKTPDAQIRWVESFWRRVVQTNRISRLVPSVIMRIIHENVFIKTKEILKVLYWFAIPQRS